MTFVEAVKTCFRKYFTFSGRASRSEFWWFTLFLILGSLVATIVNGIIFGPESAQWFNVTIDDSGNQTQGFSETTTYDGGLIGLVFSIATFLPSVSVTSRRLHDIGRSAWWMLMPIAVGAVTAVLVYLSLTEVSVDQSRIPTGIDGLDTMMIPTNLPVFFFAIFLFFAATIVLIVWLARRSHPAPNQYGPNPNEVPQ